VGSLRFDGVRFVVYSQDHEPCHVHGFYAEAEGIVELNKRARTVDLASDRANAIRPGNAKKADVKHVLHVAAAPFDELTDLWEQTHG
jgi:hypothetical protein